MDAHTTLVLECQKQPDNLELLDKARKMAMDLFYHLPVQWHYLREEQCAAFLLYCQPAIDRYLFQYKPVISFDRYVLRIVQRRIIAFKYKYIKDMHRNYTTFLASSSVASYQATDVEPCGNTIFQNQELPQVFQTLICQGPPCVKSNHPPIKRLLRALHSPSCRKGLLLSSATVPSYVLDSQVPLISKLLGCDRKMLSDFLATLDQNLFARRQRSNELIDRIGFRYYQIWHYRELYRENSDVHGRTKILQKYHYNMNTWKNYLANLDKQKDLRLSRCELEKLLGLTASNITSSMNAWKHALRDALDASTPNDYLE